MASFAFPVYFSYAHGGGLDASGCHKNKKTGDFHCHRGDTAPRVGSQTLPAISAPFKRSSRSAPLPRVSASSQGNNTFSTELIVQIQKGLIQLKYGIDEPNGILGPKTQFAIMKFQEEQELEIDGLPTLALLAEIDGKIRTIQN